MNYNCGFLEIVLFFMSFNIDVLFVVFGKDKDFVIFMVFVQNIMIENMIIIIESLEKRVVCFEDFGYFRIFYSFFCYVLIGICFLVFIFCLVVWCVGIL